MSGSEVIGMKEFVPGGLLFAALFTSVAIAQTTPTTASLPKAPHARRSYFNSDQPRSDVAAHVAKMFAKLDLNHDGFITADELAASKAKFEDQMSKRAPKRIEKAFDRLDTNRDGQITRAEIDAAQASKKSSTSKHRVASPALFVHADADKDGIVTRAEYAAAVASGKIKQRHANMRGNAIAKMFEIADVKKEGRLSLDEAQKVALEQFDAADLNHDGVLTPDERRQARPSGSSAARAK
jgi:Ca2+-binding EF-hand superfamily protein